MSRPSSSYDIRPFAQRMRQLRLRRKRRQPRWCWQRHSTLVLFAVALTCGVGSYVATARYREWQREQLTLHVNTQHGLDHLIQKNTHEQQRFMAAQYYDDDNARRHEHAIPRILSFTHYRNLLEGNTTIPFTKEEATLAANVRHIIALQQQRQPTQVKFYTDEACQASLQRVFPALVPYFQAEPAGMFKADICRGSILYETGGFYLDVDVGVLVGDLWQYLQTSTEFVTAWMHPQPNYPNNAFFQAILGAAPQSPVLYRYLQLLYNHYAGRTPLPPGTMLGVVLLERAWTDIVQQQQQQTIPTEFYQEMIYDAAYFPNLNPPPTWGTTWACHCMVVALVNENHALVNVSSQSSIWYQGHQFYVPFYSHIAGSRMCQ